MGRSCSGCWPSSSNDCPRSAIRSAPSSSSSAKRTCCRGAQGVDRADRTRGAADWLKGRRYLLRHAGPARPPGTWCGDSSDTAFNTRCAPARRSIRKRCAPRLARSARTRSWTSRRRLPSSGSEKPSCRCWTRPAHGSRCNARSMHRARRWRRAHQPSDAGWWEGAAYADIARHRSIAHRRTNGARSRTLAIREAPRAPQSGAVDRHQCGAQHRHADRAARWCPACSAPCAAAAPR